jgi:hypothetical protein
MENQLLPVGDGMWEYARNKNGNERKDKKWMPNDGERTRDIRPTDEDETTSDKRGAGWPADQGLVTAGRLSEAAQAHLLCGPGSKAARPISAH